MQEGLEKLIKLKDKMNKIKLSDKSDIFNTARIEALELDNLMLVALTTAYSSLNRKESRGAHSRIDYPHRDDQNWLKHIASTHDGLLKYRKVNFNPALVDAFEPKARTY